ncbi:CinA family protein [Agilicoccus flavus]|uniref:CinA family protein n=1 Tax=Agilicoccus flavus TaxID=2775968 RepID=UPI001CF666D9|nr:nicotinamide-nucleotide amidohydrolase family protein [Agilicoccus flavus]
MNAPASVDVAALVEHLARTGQTVATGESLTGGLVVATLVDPPGASRVVRGGVVAYHSDVKTGLLGVDVGVLVNGGPVQAEVAAQLAKGAAHRFGATWGIGTTGVAGPARSEGSAVGTVYVAVMSSATRSVRELHLPGDRAAIRVATVHAALGMLAELSALHI